MCFSLLFLFNLLAWNQGDRLKPPGLNRLTEFGQFIALTERDREKHDSTLELSWWEHFDRSLKLLAGTQTEREDINIIIPTMNYTIYNNNHPTLVVKRQPRVNNMFNKCPRLRVGAHTEMKNKHFFKALSDSIEELYSNEVHFRAKMKNLMSNLWQKGKRSRPDECTLVKIKLMKNVPHHWTGCSIIFCLTFRGENLILWTKTLLIHSDN